jgi:alkaline phosphatase D
MKKSLFTLLFVLISLLAYGQKTKSLLQSGPMVGYSEMLEVGLWVQTSESATAQIEYRLKGSQEAYKRTNAVRTSLDSAYTAHLVANQVKPCQRYEYRLLLNGKVVAINHALEFQTQALWQFRTDPPKIKFVFGSCFYINEPELDRPGRGYGNPPEIILKSIYEENADFMVWGGDNAYLREPDWGSQTGIFHRYTHTRSLPELQPLLGNMHHYATWDDHDFGPNDSDRSFYNKDLTTRAFNLFWRNPNRNMTGKNDIASSFEWGDVQFFMLDNRSQRSPQEYRGKRDYFGEEQLQWLIEALTYSRATFKFVVVGGQVVNPSQIWENYATYTEERQRLFDEIERQNIKGVFFLTGDRHHSILSMLKRPNNYPLYDLTSSSITAGSHAPADDENPFQVEGTEYSQNNYAVLEIDGERKKRVLTIAIKDINGKTVWTKSFSEDDLK